MPKTPRWTATDAERALLVAGFSHLRLKGRVLHPKIIKQVIETIQEAARSADTDP